MVQRQAHRTQLALSAAPPLSCAGELAAELRRQTLGGSSTQPLRDLESVAAHVRADIRVADLGLSHGGREALLVPQVGNRFSILVDKRFDPGSGDTGAAAVAVRRRQWRFRVAHEIGHTLFYDRAPGQAPSRVGKGGPEEEAFCDRFAAALLLPEEVAGKIRDPAKLVGLHSRFDVSLEVVARSVAAVQRRSVALFYWPLDGSEPRVQWTSEDAVARRWRRLALRALAANTAPSFPAGDVAVSLPRRQVLVVESATA